MSKGLRPLEAQGGVVIAGVVKESESAQYKLFEDAGESRKEKSETRSSDRRSTGVEWYANQTLSAVVGDLKTEISFKQTGTFTSSSRKVKEKLQAAAFKTGASADKSVEPSGAAIGAIKSLLP